MIGESSSQRQQWQGEAKGKNRGRRKEQAHLNLKGKVKSYASFARSKVTSRKTGIHTRSGYKRKATVRVNKPVSLLKKEKSICLLFVALP